jgi:hypothetical protein
MTHHVGARLLVPAVLVALAGTAGCTTDPPVAAGPVPAPSPSRPAASPSSTPRPTSPSPSPSRRPTPTYRQTRSTTLQEPLPSHLVNVGCHVSAATLNRAMPSQDRATGYRIDERTVQCWHGWAYGYDPYWYGDGDNLFQYRKNTGWHYYGAGSAFDCKTIGIKVDPKDPPPFCG